MQKLLLIDGNAIFHRAFHSLPLLTNQKGEYTNAIYGFLKMLFDILIKESPQYLMIAFDHRDKTFRHQEFVDYKANRSEPPPQLYPQLPRLLEILQALGIPCFQQSGFEADDLIGTLATQSQKSADLHCCILTGDRDAFQLVSEQVTVIMPIKGISVIEKYTPALVEAKMGLKPTQIIDYKALRGDSSDNIPGVKGIGEKQAVAFLQKYGDLDTLYQHLSELTPAQRQKLEQNKEIAYLSRRMATIICDMPIELNLEKAKMHDLDEAKAAALLTDLDIKSLHKPLAALAARLEQQKAAAKQSSLF